MIEIRVHGRGGMGAVTLVEILAKAVGLDGKYSQAFPAFGPERRGAPVKAFCRISDRPITIRSQIYNPDYVVVLDPSLLNTQEVSGGLKEESSMVINSGKKIKPANPKQRTYTFDASKLAMQVLGKNIVNTAMLGVLAKSTGLVSLDSILKVMDERFEGRMAELNKKLVTDAYNKAGGKDD